MFESIFLEDIKMSALFRSILQQVTQEKLEELKLQKELSSNYFNPVLTKIAEPSTTPTDALEILYKAIKDIPLKDVVDSTMLENVKYVLKNVKDDPSISSQLVLTWVDKVKQQIQFSLRKCEYSYLYGSLLSEWLEVEERKISNSSETTEVAHLQDPKNSTNEAALNRKEAIDKLKDLMFTEPQSEEFDPEKFRKFLSDDLFKFESNIEGQTVMKDIQKETKDYFNVENYSISSYDIQCCINGLRSEDLLSLEKKEALQELSENSEALGEVASLLTNRLRNFSRWEWPSTTETVETRRGLAGEYKSYLNEDIITALFLQYVGVIWAAFFKRQFLTLYRSKAWTKAFCFSQSIEAERKKFHESTFLSSLPDSMSSQVNKSQDEYAKVSASDVVQAPQGLSEPQYPGVQLVRVSSERISSSVGAAFPGTAAQSLGVGSYPGSSGVYGSPGVGGAGAYPGSGGIYPYSGEYYPRPTNQFQYPEPINTSSPIDFKQSFLHTLSTEIRLNQVG